MYNNITLTDGRILHTFAFFCFKYTLLVKVKFERNNFTLIKYTFDHPACFCLNIISV